MERFLGLKEITKLTGKSRPTIWRWCRDGHFPKPRKIGPNSSSWLESEILAWIEKQRTATTSTTSQEPVAVNA